MFSESALINEMDSLKKFAMKLTRNSDDADDLLQSTILRAIEKKHLFQEGTSLFSWSSKVMYNLFVSGYRRRTKFETQYDPENYIEQQSVEASQDTKVELRQVQEAMELISPEQREILIMVCVQGTQYAEAAEILNIPIGTVRSRLSRARESLQAALEARPKRSEVSPFLRKPVVSPGLSAAA